MLMNAKEISIFLNVSEPTIRVWLGHYKFNKYRHDKVRPTLYDVSDEFYNDLYEYLDYKYSRTAKTLQRRIAPYCISSMVDK